MALYTSYDTVGIKEDISDIITNLTPTKTPFQTLCGTDKTKNRTFQWMEDSLRAVQVNAKIEGFTASSATLTPPTMRTGYVQILEKTIQVTATEDAVDQYGRAKETAYQLTKGMAEVKRDLEHACVGLLQAATVGDNSTARLLTSSGSQVAAGNTTAGGTAALTEAMILANGQAVFNAGGDPTVLMIKPADSIIVAGFTGASGRARAFNDGQKTVTNAVNLYVSPFGEYKVSINRFMKTTNAMLLDPDMWSLVYLRPFTREVLAKTGDNTSHMIVGEVGLKNKNQSGNGLINALT